MIMLLTIGLLAAAGVASCNQITDTSCTSSDAIGATTNLLETQIEKAAIAKAKQDDGSYSPEPAAIRAAVALMKFTFDDTRTTKADPNSTKKFCTSMTKVVFPLTDIQDADAARAMVNLNKIDDLAETAGIQRSADTFSFWELSL
jgi:hypothetical protein